MSRGVLWVVSWSSMFPSCRQSRDWKYHIDEKVWITRMPGQTILEKNGTTERGVFYYFDAQNWRRVTRDCFIDTGKLAPTSRV